MGRVYDSIDDRLRDWLLRQPVFFVGTAPLAAGGHVNVSPKGLAGSFAILGPSQVAYLDLTGSGIETVAHLRENGRICVMFCAFEGPPRIVRLHGRARAATVGDPDFDKLAGRFPPRTGARSIVVVDVQRIADSCGFGVPLMDYQGERDQLVVWAERKGTEGVAGYWKESNVESIDGLPGLDPAPSPQTAAR
jgi:hypothetical protein